MANNSIQVRITVSKEINDLLEKAAKKLGKKKSMLAREMMEQKLYDLNLIQRELKNLDNDEN
jgi:predicted DNA-binding protein